MNMFHWKDTDTWPVFLGHESLSDSDQIPALVERFRDEYTHVRVYHACRPIDPDVYFKEGLRPTSTRRLVDQFAADIKQYCGIQIPADELNRAMTGNDLDVEGKLYVVLDDADLIAASGHYAIYGSEYLQVLTQSLRSVSVEHMKQFGTPTVYTVDLNTQDISDFTLKQLIQCVNEAVLDDNRSHRIDFTITLALPIGPERVVFKSLCHLLHST